MDFIENNYATYKLEQGVLYIRYHIGITIDLSTAVRIVSDRLKLQAGIAYPALCDIRGVREVNRSARRYLALEGSILTKAVAFIIEYPMTAVLWEFYLRSAKPPIPTQSFVDIDKARKYLMAYL